MMSSSFSHQTLPWSDVRSERKLFRVSLGCVFAIFVTVAVVVNFYEVPEPDRESLEEIPPQLAKLLKAEKAKKIEPIKTEKPPLVEPKKVEAPKPKPKAAPKPTPKVSPKDSVKKPRALKETKKSTEKQIQQARNVAKQSGILAMQSEMAALSSSVSSDGFSSSIKSTSQRSASASARKVDTVNESALTATSGVNAPDKQNVATQSIDLEASASERLEVTSEEIALAKAEREEANTRKDEEIQIVVEGLRSTFNLLYNRALRDDPFLEGMLELVIRIEPNGVVSRVDIVQNTLENDAFVAKLIARMKLTNFGASGNKAIEKNLPFEFSPS